MVNSGKDYDQKTLNESTVWNVASVSVFPAEPPILLHEATTGLLFKPCTMQYRGSKDLVTSPHGMPFDNVTKSYANP